jgi:hypothetical protein
MVIFIYMDNKLETRQDKVNFIIGIFKFYQPTLNIPEQIALLTLWEASFVLEEEYEMASAIINEMSIIQNNPNKAPQKSNSNVSYGIVENKVIKKPFYFKFFKWVKSLFKNKI